MVRRPVVAIVTDAVHPYSMGGREIRYHELTRFLAESAEVHFFTMHWWNGPRSIQTGPATYHAITRAHPFYKGGRRSIKQALFFALGSLRLLFKRFDVLCVDHIPQFQLFTLRLVATLRRKPLIGTWHEVWGPEYWRDYMGGWPGRIAWWIELASMRMPDEIIAASTQTADRLNELLGGRTPVHVAPNGIDLESVERVLPAADTTDLVIVSRLMQHKRLDMLLEAVAILHGRGHAVTCRIIGDGPERAALRALAAQLGLSRYVDFRHDVQEQKDLYALLKAGTVFPFPSNREGFGIAVLEALACGLPVVTTSAPDNLARHLVERTKDGVVCEHEAAALADAIFAVLTTERTETVVPWLAEYSWPTIADGIVKVLHQ